MKFQYNDGGRKEAGYKGTTGDCVVRSISIATRKPYKEVYNALNLLGRQERICKSRIKYSNARTGVYRKSYQKYLESLGWKWIPTMFIGSGCKVHLDANELPGGKLIVRLSRHITAVIDGVVNDIFNPCRGATIYVKNGKKSIVPETRCVYGYFIKDERR